MALAGFLKLAESSHGTDASTPLGPALDAAYALGRGEARSGRSMDALLAAYRVGARVSWRELSSSAVTVGLPSHTVAKFAELVFAYIDELSAASVAGHADELASSGRVRERYREQLGRNLLDGASSEVLVSDAERADWSPPRTLTAVLLPSAQLRGVLASLDERTLIPAEDLPGGRDADDTAVVLVPDMEGTARAHLLRVLAERRAVVGPARPWTLVRSSYLRVLKAHDLGLGPDTEEHLPEMVLTADREALDDLRDRVLAPLAGVRPATAARLAETLRSWLLHQGRRDDVAADLFVHGQTVRYRMGQIRELFGDQLSDPRCVLELTLALNDPRDDTVKAGA
jgi:hypothetical protein